MPPEPLVTASKINGALVVAAVDDAAAALGLAVGMPLATARAIHPALVIVDHDPVRDAALLGDIADWCDRFTPLVATDGLDGLVLDVTGCAHLFGGEAALLDALIGGLKRQRFGVCAAIAGTAVAARALSRSRTRVIAPEGCDARAVAALPIAALCVAEPILRGLRRTGLKTIGDVASRDPQELASRFGSAFVSSVRQSQGLEDTPISPRRSVPDYVAEKRFAEPVATSDVIAGTLRSLACVLVDAMERDGKGARLIAASFFRTDGAVRRIAIESGRPIIQAAIVSRLFAEKLDALADPIDPGFGFDLIRLDAARTIAALPSQRGFDTQAQDEEDVAQLIDRLAARLGRGCVVRYVMQDTHLPERTALAIPAQDMPAKLLVDWPSRESGEPPLRPLRLLQRPEQIDVTAMFPDGPPAHFKWRRAQHRIMRAEGPERIAEEWWRRAIGDPLSEDNHTRDYFRVEDRDGGRFWLYRHGIYIREVRTFRWFMHGVFA